MNVKSDLESKFRAFVKGIRKSDKIAVLFHPDPDGMCAATIVAKALERLNRPVKLVYNQSGAQVAITPATVTRLKRGRITRVITVDMSVDQGPETIAAIEGFAKILIIDHHVVLQDLNSKKTVMVKASLLNEEIPSDQYCTSKLAYDLFSPLAVISDLDWVACTGIVSDKGEQTWRAFLKETAARHSVNVRRFDEIESILNSARCAGVRPAQIIKGLLKARSMRDILESRLKEYDAEVRREVDKYDRAAKRLAEFHDDAQLVWYEIEPKYRIKTLLANKISFERWPNRTVLVLTKDDKVDVSARRQDRKVSMHELMRHATKDIPKASGGGHVPAAGASFPAEFLPQFKESVLGFLRERARV